MNTKRGFSPIGLLVIIIIVAALSLIVMSSLNSAKSKGEDAKIKAQLSGFRSAAKIYFDANGNYTTTDGDLNCAAKDDNLLSSVNVRSRLDAMPEGATSKCVLPAKGDVYAVATKLSAGNDYWCVDSAGVSKSIEISTPDSVTLSDTSCDALAAR